MRSEDKCDCKWCEQHYGWEQGWMTPVLATTMFLAVMIAGGLMVNGIAHAIARAVSVLLGIGS